MRRTTILFIFLFSLSTQLQASLFLMNEKQSFHCDSTEVTSDGKVSFDLTNQETENHVDFKFIGEIGKECSKVTGDCKRYEDYESVFTLDLEQNEASIRFVGRDYSLLTGDNSSGIQSNSFKLKFSILGSLDSHEVYCFLQ